MGKVILIIFTVQEWVGSLYYGLPPVCVLISGHFYIKDIKRSFFWNYEIKILSKLMLVEFDNVFDNAFYRIYVLLFFVVYYTEDIMFVPGV